MGPNDHAAAPIRAPRHWAGRRKLAPLLAGAGLALLAPAPAPAANYALIMTIGTYENPRADLPGIDLDARNAGKIAESMGVPAANIAYLSDDKLSLDGFREAFDKTSARISRGDNVFVYYSGHGTQYPEGVGKCGEGMVSYDMHAYGDLDLQRSLAHLSEKAGQVVMMNDSCFSGGQAEAKSLRSIERVPKVFKLSDAAPGYTCGEAINMKFTRALVPAVRQAGSNLLYVAASQDNEVAHASTLGSAATLAWAACLSQQADDDHSGVLNGSKIRSCAQDWLDKNNFNQHVTLVGNKELPLAFVGTADGAGDPGTTPTAARFLDNLRHAASPGMPVSLTVTSSRMRIEHDVLDFTVTTGQPGYLTILQVGSDGKTFNRLFPNDVDQDNQVPAGTLRLPRRGWAVRSGGPAGTSYLMAVLSETPRDFAKGFKAEGPFRSGEVGVASRTLYIAATGADSDQPGRFGASEVVPIEEY
jgi:hypothetical protein